jgi:transcriptional regulator with XRE-family HTH domain
VLDQAKFFERLGLRTKHLRMARGCGQEDMIFFGFSARHWQQIETGRPITVSTLLLICDAFQVSAATLIRRMD